MWEFKQCFGSISPKIQITDFLIFFLQNVKEELKSIDVNEKLRKRLRNMNIDLSSLKLEEKFKCKNGSIVKNLACGEI
jgi:hypothetical protein